MRKVTRSRVGSCKRPLDWCRVIALSPGSVGKANVVVEVTWG